MMIAVVEDFVVVVEVVILIPLHINQKNLFNYLEDMIMMIAVAEDLVVVVGAVIVKTLLAKTLVLLLLILKELMFL